MSLRRTPPTATVSNSDLTDDSCDRPTNVTNRSKRNIKRDENKREVSNKRDESNDDQLNSFMSEMRTFAQDIKIQNSDIKSELSQINTSISEFRNELNSVKKDHAKAMSIINEIQDKQATLSTDVVSLVNSLEFHSSQQSTLQDKFTKLEEKYKKNEGFESELKSISNAIQDLKYEVEQQHQWERILNLEVSGIPETKSEDLCDLFLRIAKHVGVELTINDIAHATRIQPRQNVPGRPRNIIVKLKKRIHKDNIIAGMRKMRGLSTLDISMPGDSRRVYVNEHLTVANKQLFKKCRDIAKSKSYQYLWIKNCRIFMRKNDTSPPVNIKNVMDLAKL